MAKAFSSNSTLAKTMLRAYPKDKGGEIESKDWNLSHPLVVDAGREFMKTMYNVLQKAGVSTALGFNFYDLQGPAYFIFPLLTPLIQSIPKVGKVNDGTGTVAHWKATTNPNASNEYVGVSEGQRGRIATPNEVDYYATYKELGMEGGVTFTAQFAGEGYTDNQADEHFRNLARLRLGEEMLTLCGNAGPATISNVATGNLGFALGKTPTPTLALVVNTSALSSAANVVVACVAITPMGMNAGGQAGYTTPPSVANSLIPSYVRTNADGSTLNVSCGIAQISSVSSVALTNTTAQQVNASVTPVKGAVAYAWYWSVNVASAALQNVNLGAITSAPWYLITNTASGTQTGNATGLSVDNSYQTTDFDGLMTYAFVSGTWTDMGGGSFTSAGNGEVAEIENDLLNMWLLNQAQPDAIYCAADVRQSLDSAVIYSASGTNSYIFQYTKDAQGSLLGGFMVSAYKSKYSINVEGGTAIPIKIHPMLPQGTLIYDIYTNPYPHSRIPAVRHFKLMRDYYAIEWPVIARQWTLGTYIHEVLAHYIPKITAVRTGIGKFVAPCWVAATAFDEDFYTGEKTASARRYLVNVWEKSGWVGRTSMSLYRSHGETVSKVVARYSLLKRAARYLFDRVVN
jgi:hypothetical protein